VARLCKSPAPAVGMSSPRPQLSNDAPSPAEARARRRIQGARVDEKIVPTALLADDLCTNLLAKSASDLAEVDVEHRASWVWRSNRSASPYGPETAMTTSSKR